MSKTKFCYGFETKREIKWFECFTWLEKFINKSYSFVNGERIPKSVIYGVSCELENNGIARTNNNGYDRTKYQLINNLAKIADCEKASFLFLDNNYNDSKFIEESNEHEAIEKKGKLIVFEGIDRSGKSTAANWLFQKLKSLNKECELMKFPLTSTHIGKVIEMYLSNKIELDDRAAHYLFSANRWEFEQMMSNKLLNGINLIVDRYIYSGIVYTASKNTSNLEWCIESEVGLPIADIVFFMDTDNPLANLDLQNQRFEFEDFQKSAYKNYLNLFESFKKFENSNIACRQLYNLDVRNHSIEFLNLFIFEKVLKILN